MDVIALLCMCGFFAAIFAVGVYASYRSRSHRSAEDLILANREIGLVFGVFTTTATWMGGPTILGTATYVATPGLGLMMCQAPVGYSICLMLGGLLFAEKMRKQEYVTLYDPFEKAFGSVITTLLYLPALLGDIFWSAAVLVALGSTISVLVDVDMQMTMIAAATLVVCYTLFGGLYSVAYTDVLQLLFLYFGLWMCIPFCMNNQAVTPIRDTAFDLDRLRLNASIIAELTPWVGAFPTTTPKILHYIDELLLLSLGGIPWQSFFQRILSSKSPRTARTVSLLAGVMCLIIAIPAVLIGAVAVSTDWSMTDLALDYGVDHITEDMRHLTLPLVVKYLCPYWVSLLGLGAMGAAAMSSSDSSYLSVASVVTHNVYTPLRRALSSNKPGESEQRWTLRCCVLCMAAVSTYIAISFSTVYDLLVLCSDLMYVVTFPTLTAVVFWPRWTNGYGALAGYATALVVRLSGGERAFHVKPFVRYPWHDDVTGYSEFPFRTVAMVSCLVVSLAVSRFSEAILARLPPCYDILNLVDRPKDTTTHRDKADTHTSRKLEMY